MSKQLPVQEYSPCSYQRTKRPIRSASSSPSFRVRLSASATAIAVSSVHCPAFNPNGPPPTMSLSLDRKVIPSHVTVADLFAKIRYHERPKLMVLDQSDSGCRAPISDGVEVDAEVAPPSARHGIRLMLART